MSDTELRGRIIRITGAETAIVNLGREQGIAKECTFSILAEPESVIDPFTEKELGQVSIVKGTLYVSSVHPRFTIAKLYEYVPYTQEARSARILSASVADISGSLVDILSTVEQHEELPFAQPDQIKPWEAKSGMKVGDHVIARFPKPQPKTETTAKPGSTRSKESSAQNGES